MTEEIPYGEWPSPISADDVAAETLDFAGIALEGGDPYWLERRPSQEGRGVVVTQTADGETVDVTHYEAEAPPSRSAGLPMLNRKHK